MVVFEQCRHMMMFEHPELFNDTVSEFLCRFFGKCGLFALFPEAVSIIADLDPMYERHRKWLTKTKQRDKDRLS